MAKKFKKDYFGFNYIFSLILAIIPITSAICGIVTRFSEGKIFAGIFRIICGWNIVWVCDLICMIFSHKIFRLFTI